jgi:hypothetical protein
LPCCLTAARTTYVSSLSPMPPASAEADFRIPKQRHISHIGHNALADMLTLYMREQTCETRRRMEHPVPPAKSHWPKSDILGMVPRLYSAFVICRLRTISTGL